MSRDDSRQANPTKQSLVDQARAVLKRHWGHCEFRLGQWEVIDSILSGRDVLAVLPTGTGKSVCYQLPALMKPGLTLVVSPLIALMRDQVDGLKRRGVSATYIDSTLSRREVDQRLTDAEFGKYRLLYVAPERLSSAAFTSRCERLTIRTVIVDEAHCVSEWGHSFRPSYLEIADTVGKLDSPVVAALTATATPHVRSDILALAGLTNPLVVVTGFDRPNVEWTVYREADKRRRIRSILRAVPGSAIVYTGTRRGAEEWAAWLRSQKVEAVHYHGGLSSDAREREQSAWMTDRARVMVATSAFGMGIDKPDVRCVIHVDLPLSLEAYYQEAGRAGRDGRPSQAVLVYRDGDERLPNSLIDRSFPAAEQVAAVYDAACNLGGVAVGALSNTPIDLDLEQVARVAGASVSAVRQSVDLLERSGAWTAMQEGGQGYLRMISTPAQIRPLAAGAPGEPIQAVAEYLLRGDVADAHRSWISIDPSRLAARLRISTDNVEQTLSRLDMLGHIQWKSPGATLRLILVMPRQRRAPVRADLLASGRKSARNRLADLVRYVDHRGCRRNYILTYFGEQTRARCGRCDYCLATHRKESGVAVDESIIQAVLAAARSGLSFDEWTPDTSWSDAEVDACVDWLVREGYLRVSAAPGFKLEITSAGEELI
jgi:ATP-dependent DNA helicase RecQ